MTRPQTGPEIPELIAMSARQVLALLESGEIRPGELIDAVEARVQAVDGAVNALPTHCFERARLHARRIESGERPGGLLGGIPVAIKDLSEVAGVRTTFGSLVHRDHVPERSAALVTRIEDQGGVVYAKSNTPEFGTGGNTVNAVFGPTRNPWDTRLSVAGSSGGAAAALACGSAWLAQGSDMGGSLRNPASFCGVTGLRPTPGRVVADDDDDPGNTLSTAGPMARNVGDLALFFDAMLGQNPQHPLYVPPPARPFADAARRPALPGRVAWSPDLGITPVHPDTRRVFLAALQQLERAGVELVEVQPDFSGLNDLFYVLRAHSYADRLGHLLPAHREVLNPNVAWNIERGRELGPEQVTRAERERERLVRRVRDFFREYPLILTPATVVPPYPVEQDHVQTCDGVQFDNYYQWLSIAYAFTVALSPALSLPCGLTPGGLPVGMQLAAATHQEALLLSAAAHIEEVFDMHRRVPINPNLKHLQQEQP